ncbi:hypothetical protein AVEN_174386-1 [Araneus ventricosus]|uniref:Uncharacterized protein n=1 Tax=Araneus ventricosus TaxID=182803 RepID=A0A4Y2T397_ARAVE|nr:hypothetical protein AVEN_174386-1 [Araneus ventricosus]
MEPKGVISHRFREYEKWKRSTNQNRALFPISKHKQTNRLSSRPVKNIVLMKTTYFCSNGCSHAVLQHNQTYNLLDKGFVQNRLNYPLPRDFLTFRLSIKSPLALPEGVSAYLETETKTLDVKLKLPPLLFFSNLLLLTSCTCVCSVL